MKFNKSAGIYYGYHLRFLVNPNLMNVDYFRKFKTIVVYVELNES